MFALLEEIELNFGFKEYDYPGVSEVDAAALVEPVDYEDKALVLVDLDASNDDDVAEDWYHTTGYPLELAESMLIA